MATVVVMYLDPATGRIVRRSWRLTRGAYYRQSGICDIMGRKRSRYADLSESFKAIATRETTLKAIEPEEIAEYVRRVATFSARWWKHALQTNESCEAMRAYCGKRRVLDNFFSRVFNDVRSMFGPAKKIEVAYGAAGPKMAPTGCGEVAVPTTGTYDACQRVARSFGAAVSLVDEHNSTKVSWDTRGRKQAVYIGSSSATAWDKKLRSTAAKAMPVVPDKHNASVQAFFAARKQRRCSWTRGDVDVVKAANGSVIGYGDRKKKGTDSDLRYPEVRGLRFCPERRIFLDRDVDAACTIARLRVFELRGLPRPVAFTKRPTSK
jgi:hypothetical protein